MTLRRILIAEDDPNDLEMTLAALEEHNLVNAVDVVKPVDFEAFINAVKEVGMFWAVINETPLTPARRSEELPGTARRK